MRQGVRGAGPVLLAVVAFASACLGSAMVTPTRSWAPPACLATLQEPIPGATAAADERELGARRGAALALLQRAEGCQQEVCPARRCESPEQLGASAALEQRRASLLGSLADLERRLGEAQAQDLRLREQLQGGCRDGEKSSQCGGDARPPPPPPPDRGTKSDAGLSLDADGRRPGLGSLTPPPPPPLDADPAPDPVTRFPTIEAKSKVAPREEFDVLVSLAAERFDGGTQLVQGQAGAAAGSAVLPLPPLAPGQQAWKVRVQLSTTEGLEIVGGNVAELRLPRSAGSEPAFFTVRAGEATGERLVYATFFEGHTFLARVRRKVEVVAPARESPRPPAPQPLVQGGARPAPATAIVGMSPPTGGGARDAAGPRRDGCAAGDLEPGLARAPDLSVTIHLGFDPAKPRQAELIFESPWVEVPRTVWDLPPDLEAALRRDYDAFANSSGRGLVKPGARPAEGARALMLGFGRRQWDAAPLALQVALERVLRCRGDDFRSIQIVTNEPTFPWELVTLPDGQFLGTRLAVARRHLATSGGVRVRPPQRLHLDGVTLLAPAYQGERRLPAQQAEISAVQSAASLGRGQVRVWEAATEGSGLASRLRDDARSGAFALHVAGHGETAPQGAGAYRLDLGLDGLTATEWRELAAGGRAPPFLFLNACNLAQVEPVAGVADGWAPASLQSGVAGFVGGLWPIGDRAAAEAARVFYQSALEGVPVAEALQLTRIQFLKTGDPTFLAYVYYGDPRLSFDVATPGR